MTPGCARVWETFMKRILCLAAFSLVTASLSSQSLAGFTVIKAAPKAEAGTADVLSHLYGGTFVGDDESLANGSTVATRLEDQTDQIWSGKKFTVAAVARYSGNSQGFGYFDQAKRYQPLFETTGEGFEVSGSATFAPTADSFAWGRRGNSGTQSSEAAANVDGRDHLITYEIKPSAGSPMWLLFWEDLDNAEGLTARHSVADYNDLVVSLRVATDSVPVAVPLPPAAIPSIITAGVGIALAARRKFAKK